MTGPRGFPERKERKTNKSQPHIRKKGNKHRERNERKESPSPKSERKKTIKKRIIIMYITVMALE